jgi:hypothetical protein
MRFHLRFVGPALLALAMLTSRATAQVPTQAETGELRVVNVVADGPTLDIFENFDAQSTLQLNQFDAGAVIFELNTGDYNVRAAQHGAGVDAAILDTTFPIRKDTLLTAFIVGQTSDNSVSVLILPTDQSTPPPAGMAYARLVHAVPNIGPVDVEVVPESGSKLRINNIGYKSGTDYFPVPATGISTVNVYPSGFPVPILSLQGQIPEGAVITAVAAGSLSAGTVGVYGLFDNNPGAQAPMILLSSAFTGVTEPLDATTTQSATVAPNPANDRATLGCHLDRPGSVTVRLYSSLGTLVQEMGIGTRPAGDLRIPLSLGTLPAGIYHAVVVDNGGARVAAVPVAVAR